MRRIDSRCLIIGFYAVKIFMPSKIKKNQHAPTEFELKVLAATLEIPLGQTRSYKWVAQKIGRPQAVRAVGQALRRNPFPKIIPCHRVIRHNGTLAGYAGGPSTKKAQLLAIEKEILGHIKIKIPRNKTTK